MRKIFGFVSLKEIFSIKSFIHFLVFFGITLQNKYFPGDVFCETKILFVKYFSLCVDADAVFVLLLVLVF